MKSTDMYSNVQKCEIIHADCSKSLPGKFENKVDLILTSPPYDDLRNYGGHKFDFDSVADALIPCLKEGGVLVWIVADAIRDGGETGTSFRHALGFLDRGLKLHQSLIYQKHCPLHLSTNRCLKNKENMFVFSNGKPKTANILKDRVNLTVGMGKEKSRGMARGKPNDPDAIKDVEEKGYKVHQFSKRHCIWKYRVGYRLSCSNEESKFVFNHPAIFPLKLAEDHIKTWTNEGDLVLDPMAGSGTTLRAAISLNRKAVGIEIHKPYCKLIEKRMNLLVI